MAHESPVVRAASWPLEDVVVAVLPHDDFATAVMKGHTVASIDIRLEHAAVPTDRMSAEAWMTRVFA